MKGIRLKRMEKELLKVVSQTVNSKLRDKKLQFVTISEVKLSGDFSIAKVYFTALGRKDIKTIQKTLTRSSGFIKKEIGTKQIMRSIPELHFYFDEVEENARKLDSIFDKIHKENSGNEGNKDD
ncbi:MAG: 30S ribosome-binding factor RbfA [Candidatus Cloacimonetes bacterium]|nr:30S ribosome-binding factor RbfA [Candidatus Cloacimonadota bacterium]